MRLRRISAALTASVVALGVAAIIAPPAANAATPTSIKLPALVMKGKYGSYNSGMAGGKVAGSDGSSPYAGIAYLQRRLPGSSTWTNVDRDTSPGYLLFASSTKFKRNAYYRVYYTGGTSGSSSWSSSVSAQMTVKVFRNLNDSGSCVGGCHLKGKVQPKYKKKKVLIQTKRHGHWKKYKKVRTNKKSKFRVGVQAVRGGKKYRIVVPKSKKFVKTVSGTYTARRY